MGLFSPSFKYSSDDVREMLQPVLDRYELLVVDMQRELEVEDFLEQTQEMLVSFYELEAISASVSTKLYDLTMSKKVSPASFSAAVKSFTLLGEQLDRLGGDITQSLVDFGLTYKKAISFHESAWEEAKRGQPTEMSDWELRLEGKNKWDWITKSSWV